MLSKNEKVWCIGRRTEIRKLSNMCWICVRHIRLYPKQIASSSQTMARIATKLRCHPFSITWLSYAVEGFIAE